MCKKHKLIFNFIKVEFYEYFTFIVIYLTQLHLENLEENKDYCSINKSGNPDDSKTKAGSETDSDTELKNKFSKNVDLEKQIEE